MSRQTSLTIDSPSIGTQNVFHAGELCEDSASSLMPPPTVIPISTHQVEFNNLLDRISAHDQDPSISQTHLAPVPSPILISTRKNTESVESRPTYILPREKSPQEVSQGGSSLHTEFLSTVSQESEPISVTRIVSNTEHIVKPQRKLTAKDTSAQVDNSPSRMQSEGEHGTLEQQSSPISREDRIFEGKRKLLTSDSPEEDEEETSTKTARTSPAISRSRRSKAPSLPPYDSAADPGEEIDPTVVTMATLCSDTGTGRVSSKAAEILSNHAAWKTKNREKRARMKTMMEAKKYGREETDGSEQTVDETPSAVDNAGQASTLKESAPIDNSGNGFDYSEDMATSRFNVQVRIGPNGETVIDEESLVVDRVQAEDINDYTHVVESDNTKFVNSGSYGKQYRGSRWSAEETELFYDVKYTLFFCYLNIESQFQGFVAIWRELRIDSIRFARS